ncbi:MAG: hypothetical protein HOY78_46080, partial [Saccharothrix sp.]|nr:hypothetical protein [Saccharothrix sp.]
GVGLPGGGRTVLTGAADGTARLVDLSDLPIVQPTPIRAMVVGRDRDLAATVDTGGVLRLVDISPPRGPRTAWPLTGHPGRVRATALSLDGERVLTLGEDRRLRLWRTTNPSAPELVGEVTGASVVGGEQLAVPGADGVTALFDLDSSGVLLTPSTVLALTGPGGISLMSFSPDGKRLALVHGGEATEWDITDPTRPKWGPTEYYGLRPGLESVPVGAAGDRVAVEVNGDAVLRRPGRESVELATDARSVAASGDLVAVAGADGKVRLFDVSNRDALRAAGVLRAHAGAVAQVRFAKDGHTLVTAGAGEVRFWETDPERVVERICAAGEPMAQDEWARYFPDVPYSPPCP